MICMTTSVSPGLNMLCIIFKIITFFKRLCYHMRYKIFTCSDGIMRVLISINTFDISTIYGTIPHSKLKDMLEELV